MDFSFLCCCWIGLLTDPSFNDTKCKIFKCTIFAGAGWNIVVYASFTDSVEKRHGKWLYSRNSFCCICNSTQWRCGKETCSVSTSLTQLHWLISFWNVIKKNAKHLTYRCGQDMELSHQPRFTVWPTYPSIHYLMMLSVI